ncbi:MAG: bis(5'-nucleosyl)-tetraphosphatase (symmetrical) YqeK [Limnoraphis sp. WC205]|nr:bis(5'-nucleosyl)-tetraphosphatase (symmetrical) YqeK [Limnoraphis sp. WC205]
MREQVLNWLSEQVPRSRIEHILRVEQMAIDLAIQHQLNVAIAQVAGLMHDLAKYFQPQVLLKMAIAEGVELDEILESHPHLLHADISAVVAREEFGIEDQEVLEAIANHTLGQPQMSPLSCVVFLADTLEPGRGDTASLQALRSLFDILPTALAGGFSKHHCAWISGSLTRLKPNASATFSPEVVSPQTFTPLQRSISVCPTV